MSLQIELLPAREGDCIWITYGDPNHHILIDGGRSATSTAVEQRLSDATQPLELVVVTHVDRDHIEGFLKLAKNHNIALAVKDLWFNGFDHLEGTQLIVSANYDEPPENEVFGARQGEALADAILARDWPWNKYFEGCPVEIPTNGVADPIDLAGGLKLRLLSPDRAKLESLIPKWKKECKKAGLLPGVEPIEEPDVEVMGAIDINRLAEEEFEDDESPANGASIAFLLEYNDRRVLFTGDAHVDRLVTSLLSIANGGKVKIDACKISHHGSRHNVSKELLQLIDCDNYLVSTNGSYFNHPDPVAMSRIIKYGGDNVNLFFNYRSDETSIWETPGWIQEYGYVVHYPPNENGVISIQL